MGNPCRYIWSENNLSGKPKLDLVNKTVVIGINEESKEIENSYSELICDFYSAPDVILPYKNGNNCKDEWIRYSRIVFKNLSLLAFSDKFVEFDRCATFTYTEVLTPSLSEEEMKSNIPLGKFANMSYEEVKKYEKENVSIFAEEKPEVSKPGYHVEVIPRGKYGEISKIIEEAAELKDAMEQGQKLMCLVELSDILGAIEGYLEKEYAGKITMTDLHNMSFATKRAFEAGVRK